MHFIFLKTILMTFVFCIYIAILYFNYLNTLTVKLLNYFLHYCVNKKVSIIEVMLQNVVLLPLNLTALLLLL